MAFDVNVASPVNAQDFSRPAQFMPQGLYQVNLTPDLLVTTSAGLTVAYAAGTAGEVVVNGTILAATVTASTVAVGAAHASLYRRDIVYVDTAGAVAVAAGTAASLTTVVAPTLAAARMALAEITIAPTQATLAATDIIDKRPLSMRIGWEHIDTQVLTGTAASISFASISAAYRQFRVSGYIQATAGLDIWARVNNLSDATYDMDRLLGQGAPTSTQASAATQWNVGWTVVAGGWARFTLEVTQQALAQNPVITWFSAGETSATVTAVSLVAGTQRNTTALLSRIDILASASTFAADSRFTLEGMRATT